MKKSALVFWFTGLSGSGKTTIAQKARKELSRQHKKVRVYDGDAVRRRITGHLTFSPEHIEENNRIIARLCSKDTGRYDYIFVPIISPFSRSRRLAKKIIGGVFYLVYVKTSIREAMRRDPKGLYQKALDGKIKNFIGIDRNVPYQAPKRADLVLDTEREGIATSVNRLIRFINLKEDRRHG